MSQGPTVVVAGVGRFGALHARVWREAGARVVGLVDTDPGRLAEVAAAHRVAQTDRDLAALLARQPADAVVVASDEASHADLAVTALEAGSHAFVEKPLALSTVDAQRIADTAAARGRQVVAGHISRFAAPMARMRARIAGGAVGTLCVLRLRRDFSRAWYASFGDRVHPVWESCIHDIDLAISFTGRPVRRVVATRSAAAGEAAPSVVSALLEFDGGVIATIESAWLVPAGAPGTLDDGPLALDGAIVGEAEALGLGGVIKQRLVSDALVEWTGSGAQVPDLSLWPEEDGVVGGALRREVGYAVDVFTGRRAPDVMPLREACWGVATAEAIVSSLDTGDPVRVTAPA
ncbi:Gfo/Idh/MocA family oxidoreductase [Phytohabitans sp. ZYX-F-186]|uniref:Gfo/Idh/MocA family oxidoreductase n=1 Tax=Phytohabitans maris TaxID=3071409 RepID=A0ABU0ZRL9_9ACTN|nr:Gfo/Idh/MocA family oxidoreductase [Phytohabitans sp. ZYX-F-186]MDQ7909396.1 Gfo/Idh/MocA family oxidoreductase [Phytohabitans sp. ZYX-F-186]